MNSNSNPVLSLAEQAYQLLEEKLVTLVLPPGSQVSEGQLIDMTASAARRSVKPFNVWRSRKCSRFCPAKDWLSHP